MPSEASARFPELVGSEDGNEPEWIKVEDLLADGIMPYSVADRIMKVIDDQCREIDAEERRQASAVTNP